MGYQSAERDKLKGDCCDPISHYIMHELSQSKPLADKERHWARLTEIRAAMSDQYCDTESFYKDIALKTNKPGRIARQLRVNGYEGNDCLCRLLDLEASPSHGEQYRLLAQEVYPHCEQADSIMIDMVEERGNAGGLRTLYAEKQAEKSILIRANLRLAFSIAKKYFGSKQQPLDLVQDANIGLMRAVDKFDQRKGYKFTTYAKWWIRQSLNRSMDDNEKSIRIPVYKNNDIKLLRRFDSEFMHKHGRQPTDMESANWFGIDISSVREIKQQMLYEPSSLDDYITDDDETSRIESYPSFDPTPERDVFLRERDRLLRKALTTISPREERVLRMRFGIGEKSDYTLEEVGQEFKMTRERVRQIEAQALKRMRHRIRSTYLKELLG
jgi:RNA polymerase sigma factor (sigma-70 family)